MTGIKSVGEKRLVVISGRSHPELAKAVAYSASTGYSNTFLNFAADVNQDGWVDLIRIDIPGAPAVWYENNKNLPG